MAGKYVTYWDGSNWHSSVEITLASSNVGTNGRYRLQVFDRDGTVLAEQTNILNQFQTERVDLNALVGGAGGPREGLVMVSDAGADDDEFVSVLTIRADNQDFRTGNRFVPFTRIE
jgi:hypothetical protein